MCVRLAYVAVFALTFLFASPTRSQDTFEKLADGAIREKESGWVFPRSIEGFERTSDPKLVSDTLRLSSASYTKPIGSVTIRVDVTIARSFEDSAADFQKSKGIIESAYKSGIPMFLWSEGPFAVNGESVIVGQKVFYKLGVGRVTGFTNLYMFDTGGWRVKIRVVSAMVESDTLTQVDGFVRSQHWKSVGPCEGPQCGVRKQAVAVLAASEERMAILALEQLIPKLFPETKTLCDASAIAEQASTMPVAFTDGRKFAAQLLGTCVVSRTSRISAVRISYTDEVMQRIEAGVDGLSLVGPQTFLAYSDGKKSYLGQLHDGSLSKDQIEKMLDAIVRDRASDFGVGNRNGESIIADLRLVQ